MPYGVMGSLGDMNCMSSNPLSRYFSMSFLEYAIAFGIYHNGDDMCQNTSHEPDFSLSSFMSIKSLISSSYPSWKEPKDITSLSNMA